MQLHTSVAQVEPPTPLKLAREEAHGPAEPANLINLPKTVKNLKPGLQRGLKSRPILFDIDSSKALLNAGSQSQSKCEFGLRQPVS